QPGFVSSRETISSYLSIPTSSVRRSGASENEGGAARRRCPVAPTTIPTTNIPAIIDERMEWPLKRMAPSSRTLSGLKWSMRIYPSLLAAGGARWLGVAPTTGRTSTVLVLAGAGLVLAAACWGLAHVPNLVLAPRTFLVLFTVAWLAYACGVLVTAQQRGGATVVVILSIGTLSRLVLLPASPSLSTDVYRYVWDARVSSAGIDPYAYAPVAPELA